MTEVNFTLTPDLQPIAEAIYFWHALVARGEHVRGPKFKEELRHLACVKGGVDRIIDTYYQQTIQCIAVGKGTPQIEAAKDQILTPLFRTYVGGQLGLM